MSATRSNDSNSTPETGLTVDAAADSIATILARESGEPGDEGEDTVAGAEVENTEADEATQPEEETQAEEQPSEGGEEADAEGEEAAEGEEEEPEGEQPEVSAITVDIDGKKVTLTKDEVAKGYLRTEDYTRKTQALAEERRAFQQQAAAVVQERQQYAALLPALEQQIKALSPVEPNWEELAAVDPVEFNRQWAAKSLRDQKIAAIQQEQQRLHMLAQQEAEAQASQQITAAKDMLLQRFPEWRDAAKGREGRQRVREYLAGYGYSAEEIGAVVDPRAVEIAEKARRYDEAQKAAAKGAKTTPRKPVPQAPQARPATAAVTKPGGAVVRKPVSELTIAKQRLAKTHSINDAAAVIARLL